MRRRTGNRTGGGLRTWAGAAAYIAWCRMDPAIRRHVAMPSPDGRASHPAGPIRKGTP